MPPAQEPLKVLVKKLLIRASRRNLQKQLDLRELEKELLYIRRTGHIEYPTNYLKGFRQATGRQATLIFEGFELTDRYVINMRREERLRN